MANEPDWYSYLFLGTYGHVIACDKSRGRTVWSTSLPRTGYSVVSIVCEDGVLYCASAGRLFGLDPATGEILWTNGLKGFGSGQVYLATPWSTSDTDGQSTVYAAEASARAAQASSSHTATT